LISRDLGDVNWKTVNWRQFLILKPASDGNQFCILIAKKSLKTRMAHHRGLGAERQKKKEDKTIYGAVFLFLWLL
jgi:hypothetical protein